MSKCRYDLSADCHNKDCVACVLDKVKKEINEMLETEEPEEAVFNTGLRCALNIIDKYTKGGAE